jgi:hypothetical protein
MDRKATDVTTEESLRGKGALNRGKTADML